MQSPSLNQQVKLAKNFYQLFLLINSVDFVKFILNMNASTKCTLLKSLLKQKSEASKSDLAKCNLNFAI